MRFEWGTSETTGRLAQWAADRVWGDERVFASCRCMGVYEGEKLIAVMVYHNYDPHAGVIEISGAADSARWITRPVLKEMFGYPFERAGCQMVVMRVSDKNYRLHRILLAYGFEYVRIPRLRGRNEDELIFTLTDDAWRTNRFSKCLHISQPMDDRQAA